MNLEDVIIISSGLAVIGTILILAWQVHNFRVKAERQEEVAKAYKKHSNTMEAQVKLEHEKNIVAEKEIAALTTKLNIVKTQLKRFEELTVTKNLDFVLHREPVQQYFYRVDFDGYNDRMKSDDILIRNARADLARKISEMLFLTVNVDHYRGEYGRYIETMFVLKQLDNENNIRN